MAHGDAEFAKITESIRAFYGIFSIAFSNIFLSCFWLFPFFTTKYLLFFFLFLYLKVEKAYQRLCTKRKPSLKHNTKKFKSSAKKSKKNSEKIKTSKQNLLNLQPNDSLKTENVSNRKKCKSCGRTFLSLPPVLLFLFLFFFFFFLMERIK